VKKDIERMICLRLMLKGIGETMNAYASDFYQRKPLASDAMGMDIKKSRVLVVEEQEYIRYFILCILIKMGYEVTAACDGEEGLFLFHKGSFDLVLTDLTMPSMDGWALASCIKDHSPNTRICLMTGWGEEEIRPKLKGSAVDSVLFKPFRLNELITTVHHMLG
jgi:CheY-like chemotaxis protein